VEIYKLLRTFYWKEEGKTGLNRLLNMAAFLQRPKTTEERTGLASGTSLYKKHVLKNWFVYIILSKTT